MKRIFALLIIFNFQFSIFHLSAQETYQSQRLIETDLNGTARYVGMGGAMEALGADISTMSTNPAGVAMIRSHVITATGGLNFQTNEGKSCEFAGYAIDFDGKKTRASFDQIGFVACLGKGQESFFNIGFQYRKSHNFSQILSAANYLNGGSQSKVTSLKYDYMNSHSMSSYDKELITNAIDANYEQLLKDPETKSYLGDYLYGDDYRFGQYQKGYIGEYDINFSYNYRDRWYMGLTVGLHNVQYTSNSIYDESNPSKVFTDSREDVRINGTGIDFKLGLIWRPFEEGNFRVGAYVHTPVMYNLRYDAVASTDITRPDSVYGKSNGCYYDFQLYTPWKFGVSLGDVFGTRVAVGATYEYQCLGSTDNRINRDNYGSRSYSDREMNSWTSKCLSGLHTIKVGVEVRATDKLSIRAGYNWLSPMFKRSAYRDGTIPSIGTCYSCSTDYTNWYETHRVTLGVGCKLSKHLQWDLAYQYQLRKGEFSPFMSFEDDSGQHPENNNIPQGCNISYQRHQLLTTLSYRF